MITGALGFLGRALYSAACKLWPDASIIPVGSSCGEGIDLTSSTAVEELKATLVLAGPAETILVHAAAAVKWGEPAGLLDNATMAVNIATWAKSVGIGFSVLVSGVNVYPPGPFADIKTSCAPPTFYGLGKWTAEHIWRLVLPEGQRAVVRLAGLWGWQKRPTLFWNRLLLAAAHGSAEQLPLVVDRVQSQRNYISINDAANCLLMVAENRMCGYFLAAGRDVVETGQFIEAIQRLPGSRLKVEYQDDGLLDQLVFEPSPELMPWLTPFSDDLSNTWLKIPDWVKS